MKASQTFISTLKEAPADAEVASHRLMMRAGFIKRLGAGIYTYMPLGLRVIRKVEAIIREEMNRAGAVELLMPVVQPAELWQETGRFSKMGPELLRVKDRHDRDFIIQPTSEEVITDIARQELRSYKQLPRNFNHIQTKFRDRMGLRYRAVAADTGAIGGDVSQEFQVIADTGEDAIVYCPDSDYAANIELAEALPLLAQRAAPAQPLVKTPTPGKATCEDVADLLGLPLQRTVKSLVLATDEKNERGDIVCGANEADFHMTGVNWGRDLPEPDAVADIRNVVPGDPSPDGRGVLAIQRGIEVGHIFLLGTKYSDAMRATYLDETGKPQVFVMGCYGIGVTRLLGAAIEQNHDERGIVWPASMAPFTVVVWELIGVPVRLVVSDRGLKAGTVEVQGRRDAAATVVPLAEAVASVKGRLSA